MAAMSFQTISPKNKPPFISNDGLFLSSLSYFSQDVLQFVNHLWVGFCYVVLLIEIVGNAVELGIRIVAGLNLRTPLDHLRTIVRLDVFPLLGTDGKYVVVRHFGYPWTMSGVGAEQIAKMVLAVGGTALREGGTNQIAE